MTEYNADAFETLETFETTVDIGDSEEPIKVEDLKKRDFDTLQEYQRTVQQAVAGEEVDAGSLPDFSFESEDSDRDFMALLIDHKLLEPDVDPGNVGVHALRTLLEGMVDCWMATHEIEKARAEMPTEGNG